MKCPTVFGAMLEGCAHFIIDDEADRVAVEAHTHSRECDTPNIEREGVMAICNK